MRWLRGFAFGLGVVGLAAPGSATSVDQEALPLASGLTFLHDNDTEVRQELAVGRSGLLTQIDVYVADLFGGSACCSLDVFDASSQSLLGYAVIDGDVASAGWVSFVLAVPIAVTAGQQLAFDVEHDNLLALAAASYAGGALDWACNLDGCTNPFRADPGFAADRVADGTLVRFCALPGDDCSGEWSGPYDPASPDVDPYTGFHMPVDVAFRSYVVGEPALTALLAFALAPLARRRRAR
jgi:hypothetical protein